MFCPNCGAENPDGAHFCSTCGTNLQDQPTADQQPTAPVQPTEPIQPAETQPLYAQVGENPTEPVQPTEQQPYSYAPQSEPAQQTYQYNAVPQPDAAQQTYQYDSVPQPDTTQQYPYAGTPQPEPAQQTYQYGAAPQPDATQQAYRYGAAPQPDPSQQQSPYGSAPQPPYGAAPQPQPGQSYQTGYQPAPAQKKGPNKGVIIAIVAVALVAVIAIIALGGKKDSSSSSSTPSTTTEQSSGSDASSTDSGNSSSSSDSSDASTSSDDNSAATALGVSGDGVTLGDRVTDTTCGYGFSFCPLPNMTEETTDGRIYYDGTDPYLIAIAFGGKNSDGDDARGWADWFANDNDDYAKYDLLVMQSDETTFTLQGITPDDDGDILVVRGIVNQDTVQLLCIYYKDTDAGASLASVVAVADSFQGGTGTGND